MASPKFSSLNCELRIIRAKNLDFISNQKLFVRYYLQTENNRRIRLNTREISSTHDPYWNESVSLDCFGAEDAMDKLQKQSVVFELRCRHTVPILGRIGGSKLLLRAVIGWKDVLDTSKLSIEKWVCAATTSRHVSEGVKPPALQIGMKVVVPKVVETRKKRDVRLMKLNECGCRHGRCNGCDEHIFTLAAALEML